MPGGDKKTPIGQDFAGSVSASDLMDRVYRHQRHIYDATRKHFLLGRDHLIERLDVPDGGHVLELGCGTGRNLIAAARRYPRVCFYGVDISGEMLATARRNVAAAGLDGRIVLAQGDATRVDPAVFGLQRFERVFFSYSLSMIPPWRQALAHGAGLVAPGGRLSLVDFGQQEGLPRWFERLLFAWLQKFHVHPPAKLPDAVPAIAAGLEAQASFEQLYRGYACYAEIRAVNLANNEATIEHRLEFRKMQEPPKKRRVYQVQLAEPELSQLSSQPPCLADGWRTNRSTVCHGRPPWLR